MGHRLTAAVLAALTATAALTAVAQSTAQAAPTGRTFHVDCSAGAQGADGSAARPWTTLPEANSATYGPGDLLLFKRGATCAGTLTPKGAGSADDPFAIADYDDSPQRAGLDGAGAHGCPSSTTRSTASR